FDDSHPWPRRRVRYGGAPSPHPPLPAPLPHGAPMGGLSPPPGLVLFAVGVVIPLIFRGAVGGQRGAYATGVLVLILSAAVAATLALWRERRWALAGYTGAVCVVFAYTLGDNCLERPDGVIIGAVFTLLLMAASGLSRSLRSVEMRVP